MLYLESVLTERVKKLLKETECLNPDMEITIKEMTDQNQLNGSDGAEVHGDSDGRATIFLDPDRADEYRLGHEILHIKLFRSGWTKLYAILPDYLTEQLASRIGSLTEHYLIYPELQNMGIDVATYKKNFIPRFAEWIRTESNGLEVLDNGIDICEGLLFGEPYRNTIIESMGKKYPKSLDLAFKFEKIITSTKINKRDFRKTVVLLVDFVNKWIENETQEVTNLRQTMGISPLFTESELNERASKQVYFKTKEKVIINNITHYLAFFFLKSDGTRFIAYVGDNETEPPYIQNIRKIWKTKNLKYLLKTIEMPYGILD
jgi:hypothetical protein